MTETIIVALITGFMSIAGTIITVSASIKVLQARLEDLTREVRKHNGFAERMPVVEEQIKVINHRIEDLEDENKRKKMA